jgi:transcriptional regulator with XRE-family HTH domain
MHDLASAARGRRIELGLSQADVAERIGTSRAWVNSFEREKRTVELALVFALFDTLGIGVEVSDAQALDNADSSGAPNLDDLLKEYYDR